MHRVQELAPEQYRAFRDSVTSLPDVQAAESLLEYYNRRGVEINYEQALDEATANYAGDMIRNTDALSDFIRRHSEDRTMLEKLRDAIHDLVQKLTGKTKKQAQTAERMLQEAFEAASRQAAENSKNAATKGGEAKYSVKNIVGDSGKQYGIGVYLDNDLLTGLSDTERKQMVKLRVVEELAGNSFIAYDNGNPVEISISRKNEKIRNNSGNRVPVLKELYDKYIGNEIKQEAVVLADKLIEASKHNRTEASSHSHDWLDNYGKNNWEKRTVYLQDKNKTVWEATLQIANSADGRKILYDIDPIKMTEGAIKLAPTTANNNVPQNEGGVKGKFSLKTIDEMEKSLNDMNEEYRELEIQDADFRTAPEYLALMDAIGDARARITAGCLLLRPSRRRSCF